MTMMPPPIPPNQGPPPPKQGGTGAMVPPPPTGATAAAATGKAPTPVAYRTRSGRSKIPPPNIHNNATMPMQQTQPPPSRQTNIMSMMAPPPTTSSRPTAAAVNTAPPLPTTRTTTAPPPRTIAAIAPPKTTAAATLLANNITGMSKDVDDAIAKRRAELRRLQQNRGGGIRPAGMRSALGGGLGIGAAPSSSLASARARLGGVARQPPQPPTMHQSSQRGSTRKSGSVAAMAALVNSTPTSSSTRGGNAPPQPSLRTTPSTAAITRRLDDSYGPPKKNTMGENVNVKARSESAPPPKRQPGPPQSQPITTTTTAAGGVQSASTSTSTTTAIIGGNTPISVKVDKRDSLGNFKRTSEIFPEGKQKRASGSVTSGPPSGGNLFSPSGPARHVPPPQMPTQPPVPSRSNYARQIPGKLPSSTQPNIAPSASPTHSTVNNQVNNKPNTIPKGSPVRSPFGTPRATPTMGIPPLAVVPPLTMEPPVPSVGTVPPPKSVGTAPFVPPQPTSAMFSKSGGSNYLSVQAKLVQSVTTAKASISKLEQSTVKAFVKARPKPQPKPPQKLLNEKVADENESGRSSPVVSNVHDADVEGMKARAEAAKENKTVKDEKAKADVVPTDGKAKPPPNNMTSLMNDLQRTENEKRQALVQLNKLKSTVEKSKQQNQTQEGSTRKSPSSLLVSGLLDQFKDKVATQGETEAIAWISKQLESADDKYLSPGRGRATSSSTSRGGVIRGEDDLLSSVLPPLTPRSRPGSRAASPERGGGGGLLLSQSLGHLNDAVNMSGGRGKRMTTPLPKQLNKSMGSGETETRTRSAVESDVGVEHSYLVSAAKSIPNEYGTQLSSYLVRRPYISVNKLEDEEWSTYSHLTPKEDYLQTVATAFDPNSLEILGYIEADGSVFTLTGKCNVRHGKLGKIEGESDSLDWTVFDNVEDMDRALGKVTYIDVEGNEREYWLDSIYEEALTTRESYCMSMISAAFALKEVTGGRSMMAMPSAVAGAASSQPSQQQQDVAPAGGSEFMQPAAQPMPFAAAGATDVPPKQQQQFLPSGWMETTDPASGQTYYYNEVTGVTSWERPAGVQNEPAAAAAVPKTSPFGLDVAVDATVEKSAIEKDDVAFGTTASPEQGGAEPMSREVQAQRKEGAGTMKDSMPAMEEKTSPIASDRLLPSEPKSNLPKPEEKQSQQPKSKTPKDEKKQPAKQLPGEEEGHAEPADSALTLMVISLFSLLFSIVWFAVKIPFRIGSMLFTFGVLVVSLRVIWLLFADDGGAWEMGAGVDYEYNMPGIY